MEIVYYRDKYCKNITTTVTESWSEGDVHFAHLNDVIFYAQGGGQKSDKGIIRCGDDLVKVIKCVKDEEGMPVVITDTELPVGADVKCELDYDFRFTQMRLHTALHLLHCFIEDFYGRDVDYPLTSNIEADFAYNKYPEGVVTDDVVEAVKKSFEKYIAEDSEVITYPDTEKPLYRYWKCLGRVIPCGGIHVSSLKEIGGIEIAVHTKKAVTTVKITLKED